MDDIFITTLESIVQVCDLTTSGNVSHNIATIKCKCRDMLQFYKENTVSPWHSVADGGLPKMNTDCLFLYSERLIDKGFMREDKSISLDSEFAPLIDINDVDYWMEIPELPTEQKGGLKYD